MARRAESRTGGRPATAGVIPGRYALSVGMPNSAPPFGWRWTRLTEVARLETGHTPSRRHPEYWGGDIPWVGVKDATPNHGRVIHETEENTNALGIANSSARVLPAGTVCLSRTASVGYVVVMGRPMATSQDFVNWVCSEDLDPRFLKYVLMAERDALLRFAHGTTHQTIYFPEVKAFHIAMPEIEEQRAIASVLGALDDKIELNRRMSETLEALARAIFTSWFVDFDPVRARAEGRQPVGMDAETASLFPDSFEDSPLGPIPSGWYAGELGDVVAMNRRSRLPNYPHGEIEYVDIASVKQGRLEGSTTMPVEDAPSRARRLVGDGDIIWSCVRPNRRSYLRIDSPAENLVVSTGFVVLTPTVVPSSYLYLAATTDDFVDYLTANADGSAYPAVRPEHFDRAPVLIPDDRVLEAFDQIAKPLLRRMSAGERESRTLAATRDALLPKLISGELRSPPFRMDRTPVL